MVHTVGVADPQHLAQLRQGPEIWNRYRRRQDLRDRVAARFEDNYDEAKNLVLKALNTRRPDGVLNIKSF